ncbi:ankyrin-3-like [Corticium candelabrum]|uniref:ankyrin-3-like n=1 Tax=Corticium candelabrum TaxID=121492 RepID=UPI002E2721D6|nr:ankyrin-3-like [Corticium candelabrum]
MKRNVVQAARIRDWDEVQRLIEQGGNVNDEDERRRTALHYAVLLGKRRDCAFLLSRGANVSQTDVDGCQPLHLAASGNCSDICKLLIDHSADVTAVNTNGDTPLLIALDSFQSSALYRSLVTNESVNIADRLGNHALHKAISKAKVNAVDKDGNAPLHLACKERHSFTANLLFSHGADVNALNKQLKEPVLLANESIHKPFIAHDESMKDYGDDLYRAAQNGDISVFQYRNRKSDLNVSNRTKDTLLHAAAGGWKDCPDLCSMLLGLGARLNAVDGDGNQPLHLACRRGHTKSSNVLLSWGADAVALNIARQTPLHTAAGGWKDCPELCSILVEHKAKINAVDKDDNQPLHLACQKGHTKCSAFLLSSGVDANALNENRQTPLHIVVSNLSELSVLCSVLLQYKAKIDAVDEDGNQPLHLACEKHHTEISRLLLSKGANASAVNGMGQTPLHIVVGNRSELSELCSLLLRHNAKTDAVDEDGNQPLHLACKRRHTEISRLLLSKEANASAGANASAVNVMGETPLHIVVSKSSELSELCSLLLQHNAKIDTVDKDGNQPLHLACKRRHTEISRLLLSKEANASAGANASAVNVMGETPLHIVVSKSSELSELCSLLLQHNAKIDTVDKDEICRLLLSNGANASAVNKKGLTPLHIVVDECSELSELCSLLLQYKAKIDAVDEDGNQPLHLACAQGHIATSLLLLSNGANANAVNEKGQTPLHTAAGGWKDCSQLCSILLEHEAKIDAVDKDGNQPLHFACEHHHTEISQLLLSNGANASAVNKKGLTPLHIVCKLSELSELCSSLVEQKAKIDAQDHIEASLLLLSNGENANSLNADGQTPLHTAADGLKDCHKLCSNLVEHKAKIDAVDKDGNQPLHLACESGLVTTVKHLLDCNVDVFATNKFHQTALHKAACSNRDCPTISVMLIAKGAHVNATDGNGNTSLQVAYQKGNSKTVEVLIESDSDRKILNTNDDESNIATTFLS